MSISNFYRGDTKKINLEFKDSNNNPINLTGAKIFFTMKKNIDDSDDNAFVSKVVTTHTDPVNGKTKIVLDSNDTNIEPGVYYYDIQLVLSNGEVYTIAIGKVKVYKDITRRIT